jgi:hypothetical protein
MYASQLDVSYQIGFPAHADWQGNYTCTNDYNDPSWTWYLDGNKSLVNKPHVTVAFGLVHEVATSRVWKGFHVSVPLITGSNLSINARYNYVIVNGNATYSNTTTKGFTAESLILIEEFGTNNERRINEFAEAFYAEAVVTDFRKTLALIS